VEWDSDLLDLVRERLPGTLTVDGETLRDPDVPDELPRKATIDSILDAPTFEDFSIRLENVHGDVHVWAGGAMSQVPTAAYDPIFWAHHAMIDRLWYLWQMRHPGMDPAASLMQQVLTPFPMTVAQTLNIQNLGYEYAVQSSG
jgi:tyrosinase